MRSPVRFRPPPLEQSPELRWLLKQAFARAEAPMTQRVNPGRVVSLALELDLAARVAALKDLSLVSAELGRDAAERFAFARLAAARAQHDVAELVTRVGEIASREGLEIVLLKYAALARLGRIREGSRNVRDFDVLGRSGEIERLYRILLAEGFEDCGHPRQPHHLPALRSASGGIVEIHSLIPGLRIGDAGHGTTATADALIAAGLVERCGMTTVSFAGTALRADCPTMWIPSVDVLRAHAIFHGFVQHGAVPDDYPMMRMLCDVADLGIDDGTEALAQRAYGLLDGEMTLDEITAIFALVVRLCKGQLDTLDFASAEGRLLRHVVASACDLDYRRSLKLVRARTIGLGHELAPALMRVFAPSRGELELHGGPIRSAVDYGLRRVLYPLRKAFELVGAAAGGLRLRSRKQRRSDESFD